MTSVLRFAIALIVLQVALGCNRPSNPTSDKGPGGFPKQNFDSTNNVIAWEMPPELAYPNMTQRYPDNNRIYLSPDGPDTVAEFFVSKLPGGRKEEINGKVHCKVVNDQYEIDILRGGDQTEITYTDVTLGVSKSAKPKCGG
ncbi:MAG: hypothetical protein ABI743_00355 [bacterium]